MDEALGQQHCVPVSAKTYAGNVRGPLPVYPVAVEHIRDPAYRFSTTTYGRWSPGVDSLRSEPLAVLRRCPMHDLVFRLRRILQPVEKVDVGPVGGPREAQNKAKTLQKRRFQPLVQRLKRARWSFSTGCLLLRTSVNRGDLRYRLGPECGNLGRSKGLRAFRLARRL